MNKRAPQRTCIACRRVGAKRELVRLVRTAGEGVVLDPGGRKAGRGAYLCLRPECLEAGLAGGRLEHALKVKISADDRASLVLAAAALARGGEPEE